MEATTEFQHYRVSRIVRCEMIGYSTRDVSPDEEIRRANVAGSHRVDRYRVRGPMLSTYRGETRQSRSIGIFGLDRLLLRR